MHGERSDALRDSSAELTRIFLILPVPLRSRFYSSGLLSMLPLVEGEAASADRVLRFFNGVFSSRVAVERSSPPFKGGSAC